MPRDWVLIDKDYFDFMLILDFPSGWYVLLVFSIILFAVFSCLRKSFSGCVKFGIIGLVISVITESIGILLGLWNYTNGNWPVILWPTYFIYTAAFYQIFKVVDGAKRKELRRR